MIPRMVSCARVDEWRNGKWRAFTDDLVGEEPLEIRIGETPISVTMRTPGYDCELALGFLFSEGLLRVGDKVTSVQHEADEDQDGRNRVRVDLATGRARDEEFTKRNFYSTASCGVCGKASINGVRLQQLESLNVECQVDPEVLSGLPGQLRAAQAVFERTGSLHAAGLFSRQGELVIVREDVGRHNAVDKIIGWALMNGRLPLCESVLVVSGRTGFEIVQKVIVAGIPVLASVSAPSDLAVNLARELGLTMVGFLRGKRFLVYSGAQRLLPADNGAYRPGRGMPNRAAEAARLVR